MSSRVELEANPFALLNVTTRDDAGRVMQAVEDQSLVHDHATCQRAGATLTHPRRRLEAEIGWYPGLNPNAARKASAAASLREIDELGICGLARANAIAGIAATQVEWTSEDLARFIRELFGAADDVDQHRLLVDINEDRQLAGYPPVGGIPPIDDELERRRANWRQTLLRSFDDIPTDVMSGAMFRLAADTDKGAMPHSLHEFIDDYGLRAQPFMAAEIGRARRLVEKAKSLAGTRPDALEPLIDALGTMLETWQQVTYPMHVSLAERGQSYEESEQMAFLVRDLAIELNNDHNLIAPARRISSMLHEAFAASPQIAGKISEDTEALAQLESESRERENELSYSARVGLFGRNKLSISSAGLEWNGQFYPAESIRSARWGAVRKSVNGVPTGTDYLIAWSDGSRREAVVTFGKGEIFEAMAPRMVKLLILTILNRLFAGLLNGQDLRFGSAVVRDEGVVLNKPRFFGSDQIEYPWSEVSILSANGNLVISATAEPKAKAEISYRDVQNVHFLEIAIRTIFESGRNRLSEAFR